MTLQNVCILPHKYKVS